jgi:carbamoyltransferase
MMVLGINAYHGDVSAVLLRDGELVAAVEEERLRRVKHWAGFPLESIRTCLQLAGVTPMAVDHVAISRDPRADLVRKALFTVRRLPSPGLI